MRVLLWILVWWVGGAHANYASCILDRLPGLENDAAISAGVQSCAREHPGSYFSIERGSGRGILGLFGFSSAEACIIKRGGSTRHNRAGALIGAACRCLYGEPEFEKEMCAYRVVDAPVPTPIPAPIPAPPIAAPEPPAQNFATSRPAAAPPTLDPGPSPRLRARLAAEKADLDAIAERAVADFPYLDTPEGADAVAKIVERRDALIRQGVYPSIALTRAVQAFAPFMAPIQRQATERPPVEPTPTSSPGGHAGFDPKCRWETPTKWTCD